MNAIQTLWEQHKAALAAAFVALLVIASCFTVVDEKTQAVVVRLGEPNRVINKFRPDVDFGKTGAGIVWRIPFMEQVVEVDRRILDLDMERQQVLSADQRRLEVDAFARFRVIDPVRMVQTAGTTTRVAEQLQPILNSALRQELGKRSFASLLTADRGRAMEEIRSSLDREAREYGAQIIDVRIKRADLPEGTPLDSAFTRMATARQQEAATLRAQGQKQAQIIRATAEASAAKTYADSFG
ncbi:MAG: protease modulator HflC, partial [Novosphingobium meiothermophilum]